MPSHLSLKETVTRGKRLEHFISFSRLGSCHRVWLHKPLGEREWSEGERKKKRRDGRIEKKTLTTGTVNRRERYFAADKIHRAFEGLVGLWLPKTISLLLNGSVSADFLLCVCVFAPLYPFVTHLYVQESIDAVGSGLPYGVGVIETDRKQ